MGQLFSLTDIRPISKGNSIHGWNSWGEPGKFLIWYNSQQTERYTSRHPYLLEDSLPTAFPLATNTAFTGTTLMSELIIAMPFEDPF